MNEGKLRMKQISDTIYVLEEFVDGTWRRMDNTAISFEQAKAKAEEQNLTVVGLDDKVQWPKSAEPDAKPDPVTETPAPAAATAEDYAAGEASTAKTEADKPHKPSK